MTYVLVFHFLMGIALTSPTWVEYKSEQHFHLMSECQAAKSKAQLPADTIGYILCEETNET